MGLLDKINDKINKAGTDAASGLIKGKINSTIKNLIKEKRLAILETGRVIYTNKQGEEQNITVDEMAVILVNASGEYYLLQVGITALDIKEMITKNLGETRR